MAWRPYANLIDGELDNRVPEKVTGWMRFFRRTGKPLKVTFDLAGDFHEDIRGRVICLSNPTPSDKNEQLDRKGSYMEGFARVQRGVAGDITAGLSLGPWTQELAKKLMAQNEHFWDESGLTGAERELRRRQWAEHYRQQIEAGRSYYAYAPYPYIEWYSEENGRVVLELDPSQVEVRGGPPQKEKSPKELQRDRTKRKQAMVNFLGSAAKELSEKSRKDGGGNVTGIVVG